MYMLVFTSKMATTFKLTIKISSFLIIYLKEKTTIFILQQKTLFYHQNYNSEYVFYLLYQFKMIPFLF